MLKRSVVFSHPASLSLRYNQLVITMKDLPDERRTIPIEDIGFLMVDNPMVSISVPLLNALTENNVSVVFCNQKGMPTSMLFNLDNNNTQGETLRNQLSASPSFNKRLWKQIIECKIKNQAQLLEKLGKEGKCLFPYYNNVKSGDSTNREGAAAKLYWTQLFGKDFIRDRTQSGTNALLNYGYTILRAAVTRAMISAGLFPALGIFHHNRSNAFPLADDIMEPYRPFVDEIVYHLTQNGQTTLTTEVKGILIKLLYCDTYFINVTRPLSVGLTMTMASLVKYYAKEVKKISLPLLK